MEKLQYLEEKYNSLIDSDAFQLMDIIEEIGIQEKNVWIYYDDNPIFDRIFKDVKWYIKQEEDYYPYMNKVECFHNEYNFKQLINDMEFIYCYRRLMFDQSLPNPVFKVFYNHNN